MFWITARVLRVILAAVVLGLQGGFLTGLWAAPVTWIGGNNNWIDGAGNDASWNPADEPDADDEAIFNTNHMVDMATANAVNGLTMSGGIDLSNDGHDLLVDGLAQLSGSGTNLFIEGAASTIAADDVTIGNGSAIELVGGTLVADDEGLLAVGTIAVNSGGAVVGHGAVTLADSPLIASTVFNNNGTLTAVTRVAVIGQNPPANTLSIHAAGSTQRIDLDGSGETGAVNVNRNQTLDINGTLADEFNGFLSMSQNSTLDISTAWTLGAGGLINIDNGEGMGIPTIPAGIATISGGALAQTGGTINVVDNDGTLVLAAPLNMTGGGFVNNGHVVFNGNATIGAGASFTMPTNDSSLTVEAGRIVTFNQANFNADGGGQTTNVITINSNGILNLNLGAGADDSLSGMLRLNGGALSVATSDDAWSIDGTLQVGMDTGISQLNGEELAIANANVTIGANSTLRVGAPLRLGGGSIMGTGTLAFNNRVDVNSATTLNLVGGTVDLDGTDTVGDTIDIARPLVIHAQTLESFGRTNAGGGVNTIVVDSSDVGFTGSLTVNLDNPDAEWTLNEQSIMNLVNENVLATLLAGSGVNLNGLVNVTGLVGTSARANFANITNLNTAAGGLRLQGGSFDDPNRLVGGAINGPGTLQAAPGTALVGHGIINGPVDFDGNSRLIAEDGELDVNAGIVDVGTIIVNGEGATLSLFQPLDTAVTDFGVSLNGGLLEGAAVTTASVAKGINGSGRVTNVVHNNGALHAQGGNLVVENTASDWDGAANSGRLSANSGTLEVRDNAPFTFGGLVLVNTGARVYANGFGMNFSQGSTLELTGGTFESSSSTSLSGSVIVNDSSTATIKVHNNSFLTFEPSSVTTLNDDLRLENNNIVIEAGASFAGGGTLIVPDGSHVAPENSAEIGVVFQLEGSLRPAQINDVARVEFLDYQQTSTGKLYVDLTGTGLGDFDRLVVDGTADIDGFLEIDLDDGFEPVLGNTFPIITAAARLGEFDYYDIENINEMPNGLTFKINYLSNAVQLEVVVKEFFEADFDEDGDVDPTDYKIWKSAFGLNQLGDANGDNISDAADYTIWRNQLGSVSGGGAGTVIDFEAVPEPAAAMLWMLAMAAIGGVARRRIIEHRGREAGRFAGKSLRPVRWRIFVNCAKNSGIQQ